MWMWQSVIKLVVGLSSLVFRRWSFVVGRSSLVLGDRSILFVGGLKDGPFRKHPDHLPPIFGSESRRGQWLRGFRGQIAYRLGERFVYYLSGKQLASALHQKGRGIDGR